MYLWEDHLDYLTLTSLNDKSSSPLTPCDNVMTFILACMHKNDCKTAARLAQSKMSVFTPGCGWWPSTAIMRRLGIIPVSCQIMFGREKVG